MRPPIPLRGREHLARYRQAFQHFDVAKCAAMSDAQLEALLTGPLAIVRNRAKIWSVRSNARCVLALRKAPYVTPHGQVCSDLDALLWSFVPGSRPKLQRWPDKASIPATSAEGDAMSKALRSAAIVTEPEGKDMKEITCLCEGVLCAWCSTSRPQGVLQTLWDALRSA